MMSSTRLLAALALALPAAVHAGVIAVPDDVPTIAAAVKAAGPFGFVLVRPGTYAERLHIERGMTGLGLTSAEDERPVILPPGGGDAIRVTKVDDVSISSLEIRGGNRAIRLDHANGCAVSDVVATGNAEAIQVTSGGNHLVEDGAPLGRGHLLEHLRHHPAGVRPVAPVVRVVRRPHHGLDPDGVPVPGPSDYLLRARDYGRVAARRASPKEARPARRRPMVKGCGSPVSADAGRNDRCCGARRSRRPRGVW